MRLFEVDAGTQESREVESYKKIKDNGSYDARVELTSGAKEFIYAKGRDDIMDTANNLGLCMGSDVFKVHFFPQGSLKEVNF